MTGTERAGRAVGGERERGESRVDGGGREREEQEQGSGHRDRGVETETAVGNGQAGWESGRQAAGTVAGNRGRRRVGQGS